MNTEDSESKTKNKIYTRLFFFALIGFIIFFMGAWFRLQQTGAFDSQNPYSGPSPLMTCLFLGFFGLVIGAVTSLFKKRR